MPLIVEDGRCPAFANSYISLADADAFLCGRGLWAATPATEAPGPDEPEGADSGPDSVDKGGVEPKEESAPVLDAEIVAAKESALIRAFDFLNTLKWKGKKPCWERIPAWPRENVPIPGADPVEFIEPDFIPMAVQFAQCELAALIYGGYGVFAPRERGGQYSSLSESKSESVDVLSESESRSLAYKDGAPLETYLPSVYPLIEPFLEEISGRPKCGFTVTPILQSC